MTGLGWAEAGSVGPIKVSKPVAHVPDGLDEGVVGVLYLTAQPPDVYVHRAGPAEVVRSPISG